MARTVIQLKFNAFPIVDENGLTVTSTAGVSVSGGNGIFSMSGAAAYSYEEVTSNTDLGNSEDFVLTLQDWKIVGSIGDGNDCYFFNQGNAGIFTLIILTISNIQLSLVYLSGGVLQARNIWTGVSDFTNAHTYILTRESGIYTVTRDGTPLTKTESGLDGYSLPSFEGGSNLSIFGSAAYQGSDFDSYFGEVKLEKDDLPPTPSSSLGGIEPLLIRTFRRF